MSPIRRNVVLALAFAVATVPHVFALFQPYFGDEAAILLNVIKFVSERTLVPQYTTYPTLYSYLATPFIGVGAAVTWLTGDFNNAAEAAAYLYKLHPRNLAMPARLLSVLLLFASAVVLYRTVAARRSAFAGTVAGLLVLLSPSLLAYGSYALPDVAVFAFCAFSFSLLLRFIDKHPGATAVRSLFLSAALAGLAISSKYNAAAAVVPIGVALLILVLERRLKPLRGGALCVISAVCCIGAFLLGSPGWLIAPGNYLDGLLYEMGHAARGHLGYTGLPILGQVELMLIGAPIIFLAGLAGIGAWLRERSSDGWIALSAIAASIALASFSSKQSLHYLYPSFVGWLYFAGVFAQWIGTAAPRAALVTSTGIAAILLGHSVLTGVRDLGPSANEMTAQWLYQHVPAGATVAIDWSYMPRLFSAQDVAKIKRTYGSYAKPIIREIREEKAIYDLVPIAYSTQWLDSTKAAYLITGDLVFKRFFCFGQFTRRLPADNTPLRQRFDTRRAFYAALFDSASWRLLRSFSAGSGPKTYVFARAREGSQASRGSASNKRTIVRC